jgi:Spy/CpxP family protein refolding chaperone
MKKTLFAFAAVLLLAVVAIAADPAGKMHMKRMEDHLATMLDLTDAQQATAKQLHEELAAKAEPLMEQQRQQWEDIHALLASDTPDATAIGNKAIALYATHKQLEALHEDFKSRFAAALTDEQKAKFEKLHEMHGEHGYGEHGFGPGCGHGPGY